MVIVASLWILAKMKKAGYSSYLAIPFVFEHALAVVCVYNEWLPKSWIGASKQELSNSLLLCFVMGNSVPLVEFKYTLFGMFPVLMATVHV